jgi:hypothetical protein
VWHSRQRVSRTSRAASNGVAPKAKPGMPMIVIQNGRIRWDTCSPFASLQMTFRTYSQVKVVKPVVF